MELDRSYYDSIATHISSACFLEDPLEGSNQTNIVLPRKKRHLIDYFMG